MYILDDVAERLKALSSLGLQLTLRNNVMVECVCVHIEY